MTPDPVDVAFEQLLKSLLLERMTGMPRWELSPSPRSELEKVYPRKPLTFKADPPRALRRVS